LRYIFRYGSSMSTSTDMSLKTYENRLRREAKRRGLLLVKSPRRDPQAFDYGLYVLVPERQELFKRGKGLTMAAVAETLGGVLEGGVRGVGPLAPREIAARLRGMLDEVQMCRGQNVGFALADLLDDLAALAEQLEQAEGVGV
jgi:hypothetical protein